MGPCAGPQIWVCEPYLAGLHDYFLLWQDEMFVSLVAGQKVVPKLSIFGFCFSFARAKSSCADRVPDLSPLVTCARFFLLELDARRKFERCMGRVQLCIRQLGSFRELAE